MTTVPGTGRYRVADVPAENPNCPAAIHAHSWKQWRLGGRTCVCPSTIAAVRAMQKKINDSRRGQKDLSPRVRTGGSYKVRKTRINLDLADEHDVETVLMGFPFTPYRYGHREGISLHTEAAVVLALLKKRWRTDKIAWKIKCEGRTVERIKAELRELGHEYPPAMTLVEEHGWREDPMINTARYSRSTASKRLRRDITNSYRDAMAS